MKTAFDMGMGSKFFSSVKSLAKVMLLSRPCSRLKGMAEGQRVFILANGPSLADTIREHSDLLKSAPSLAVNFAAIAPDFKILRPRYYVLADPHFFTTDNCDKNLEMLRKALAAVDWKMTLFVPVKFRKAASKIYDGIHDIRTFNNVGAEGFTGFSHLLFRTGLAMPRPRNVLIPSLMIALAMGYTEIIVFGADHSWTKTLSVTDENEVVSIQPHFYADGEDEKARVRHEYRNYRLHQIVESFAIAFRSYHDIAAYAGHIGVSILNATPGSFIDAFARVRAEDLEKEPE